jgi:hypothetical protein
LSSVLSQEHNPTTIATSSSLATSSGQTSLSSSSSSSSTPSLGAAPAENASNRLEALSWVIGMSFGFVILVVGAS